MHTGLTCCLKYNPGIVCRVLTVWFKLQQMLQELSDESRRMGLKMNIAKTKVMVVDNTSINVNNVLIENVPG